jgi:NET1-associated nuclear protein 1 (U3 small nucleolar RNA-associated protein 17)
MLNRYILVATKQSLNIYSTTTSLLVRRLYIGGQGIVGVKISLVHSNLAYIADKSGTVDLWNWVHGEKILSVTHNGRVHALDVVISSSPDTEMIYLLGSISGDEVSTEALSQISAFAVQNQTSTSVSKLFQSQYDLQMLQVLNGGEFITVASNSVVIIGKRIKARPGQTGDELGSAINEYRWNELGFPQGLTCFDAHVKSNTLGDVNKSNQSKKAKNSGNIDIAFGSNEGSIFLYEDIANNILKPSTLRPRKLHWHRNSVGSVKWSVDGM